MTHKISFGIALVACFTGGFIACRSTGSLATDIKTGVTLAGEVCTFINEFLDDGTLATICATATEIGNFGHDVPKIVAYRRAQAMTNVR